MEDREIITLYFSRSEQAIQETSLKYGSYCTRIAYNILGNLSDTEECVNDTYYAAWQAIPPQVPTCLRVFLGTIIRNLSISRYRFNSAKRRYHEMDLLLSELEECIPAASSVEEAITADELAKDIGSWLEKLSREDCAIFIRRYWNGESVSALAGEIGCSPIRLTQRLLRLRKKLKKHLEQKGVIL